MRGLGVTSKALCCSKYVYNYKSLKSLYCSITRNAGIPVPELDTDYLCNVKYKSEIEKNIQHRKGVGNIGRVHELHYKLQNDCHSEEKRMNLLQEFRKEAMQIPNKTCPAVQLYGDNPRVVKVIGNKTKFDFRPKEFSEITKMLHLIRTDNLSNMSDHRSYYLMGELAEMEHALVLFTVKNLLARKFKLISVPDILPAHIIESCGIATGGDRTQVRGTHDAQNSGLACFICQFGM
jgi:seryl-tRNA synthetase